LSQHPGDLGLRQRVQHLDGLGRSRAAILHFWKPQNESDAEGGFVSYLFDGWAENHHVYTQIRRLLPSQRLREHHLLQRQALDIPVVEPCCYFICSCLPGIRPLLNGLYSKYYIVLPGSDGGSGRAKDDVVTIVALVAVILGRVMLVPPIILLAITKVPEALCLFGCIIPSLWTMSLIPASLERL